MDYATLSDLIVKLGLGGAGMFGIVYVAIFFTKSASRERESREKYLSDYIETNNHQATALTEKAIESITRMNSMGDKLVEAMGTQNGISQQILTSILSKK